MAKFLRILEQVHHEFLLILTDSPKHSPQNQGKCLGEFESKSVKSWDAPVQEFSQTLPKFSPGYTSMDNIFYFFYKIIFRLNKETGNIQSLYVYFNFFHETVNSHNLEIEPTICIAHIISVLYSTMKTHLQINQNAQFTTLIIL